MASTNHIEAAMNPRGQVSDTSSSVTNICPDRIVRLKAYLVDTNLEFQCKKDECVSLQNQVDILIQEIDSYKKTDKNQKSEVKRLTNENVRLRK